MGRIITFYIRDSYCKVPTTGPDTVNVTKTNISHDARSDDTLFGNPFSPVVTDSFTIQGMGYPSDFGDRNFKFESVASQWASVTISDTQTA